MATKKTATKGKLKEVTVTKEMVKGKKTPLPDNLVKAMKQAKENKEAKAPKAPKKVKAPKPPAPKVEITADTDLRKVPKDQRPAPTTGSAQEGVDLYRETLNANERGVVEMALKIKDPPFTILRVSPTQDAAGKLKARNGIRRLAAGKWLKKHDRGCYSLTDLARKRWTEKTPAPESAKARKGGRKPNPNKAPSTKPATAKPGKVNGVTLADLRAAVSGVAPKLDAKSAEYRLAVILFAGAAVGEDNAKIKKLTAYPDALINRTIRNGSIDRFLKAGADWTEKGFNKFVAKEVKGTLPKAKETASA